MTRGGIELALDAFLRPRPFRPFLVEVASGDRILIDHPEAYTLKGDILMIKSIKQGTDPRILGIDQITQLLFPPPKPAP